MNKFYLSILISFAIFIQQNDALSGGTNVTSLNEFGYQAAVICPKLTCSATIISTKAVLTTATCINTLSPADVIVLVGSINIAEGGKNITVASIVPHPSFNKKTYENNIAVLGFTTPLTSTDMSTYGLTVIELSTTPVPVNTTGVVSAYGATKPKSSSANYLQTISLVVETTQLCKKLKPKASLKTMFCAGDPQGLKDLCPGDQGAPFVVDGKLYGNYNKACSCGLAASSKPQLPSSPLFNQISVFNEWINSTVNGFQ